MTLFQGLGLRNTTYSVVLGFANIPWQIKAIYGIVSDTFPIFGRHRSPYIALAAACGFVSYMFLAAGVVENAFTVGFLLFLTNFAQASPDVMIDASIAERSKTHPLFAADLQVCGTRPCANLQACFEILGDERHRSWVLSTSSRFTTCAEPFAAQRPPRRIIVPSRMRIMPVLTTRTPPHRLSAGARTSSSP